MHARLERVIERSRADEAKSKANGSTTDGEKVGEGHVVLNLLNRSILIDDHETILTPIEFRILGTLMRNPGKVISRDELIHVVWQDKATNMNRFVDTHINKIRKKFGPYKNYLQTRYGSGYCYNVAG